MSDKNNINCDKRILDFQRMTDHQSLIEHLKVLMGRYSELNVVPLAMIDGRVIPMISFGKGSRVTVYTADTTGASFLPSQLLMRYINEYCEIRRSGRRVFSLDLQSFEESRTVCVIPLAYGPDGTVYKADSAVRDCRLSIELRRGDGHIGCCPSSCTGRNRGIAQSVSRLCGLRSAIDANQQESYEPHFNIYCGDDYETDEQGFFRTYASVRELLFVAPIIV